MNFDYPEKVLDLRARMSKFMDEHIYPAEHTFQAQISAAEDRFSTPPLMNELKAKAKEEGLWNLFLPDPHHGAGLTNLEYAPLAELTGRVWWAPEVFNCNAPDTGNMETLHLYGTPEQQERWLKPLLAGEIRSGFCMTEPDVASSDATNMECTIERDGAEYVVNGRKWFTTGGMRQSCAIFIVMGRSAGEEAPKHQRHSMVLVPRETPGVTIERHVTVLGIDEAPFGEPIIRFDNVRVPADNLLLGEGRGFEIAQGRLGPGRIHHCMRLIGAAQRALELMLDRVERRSTFGRKLSQHQSIREDIAQSYCDIEQARLLTLKAAARMDSHGNKVARDLIAAIKIVAPSMAMRVIDRAIQAHGGLGLTEDLPLAHLYISARCLRMADGPDQVHMMALGRQLVRDYIAETETRAA